MRRKLLQIKSKIEKACLNSKLLPRNIIFNTLKKLQITEKFENISDILVRCELTVKVDPSKVIVDKKFSANGNTKKDAVNNAYGKIISLLKSSE